MELARDDDISATLEGTRKRSFMIGPVQLFVPSALHATMQIDLEYLALLIGNGGMPADAPEIPMTAMVSLESFNQFMDTLPATYQTLTAAAENTQMLLARITALENQLAAVAGWSENTNPHYVTHGEAEQFISRQEYAINLNNCSASLQQLQRDVIDNRERTLEIANTHRIVEWSDVDFKPESFPAALHDHPVQCVELSSGEFTVPAFKGSYFLLCRHDYAGTITLPRANMTVLGNEGHRGALFYLRTSAGRIHLASQGGKFLRKGAVSAVNEITVQPYSFISLLTDGAWCWLEV